MMPQPIAATLSWCEVTIAAYLGAQMQVRGLVNQLPHSDDFNGAYEEGWTMHIEGACAEMAVAKALNIYAEPRPTAFKAADLGENIQVRQTPEHTNCLIVRPRNIERRPNDVYVHVTGTAPNFLVHGWMLARDAKRAHWLKDYGGRPPAYFVPAAELHPMETLPMEHRA